MTTTGEVRPIFYRFIVIILLHYFNQFYDQIGKCKC